MRVCECLCRRFRLCSRTQCGMCVFTGVAQVVFPLGLFWIRVQWPHLQRRALVVDSTAHPFSPFSPCEPIGVSVVSGKGTGCRGASELS